MKRWSNIQTFYIIVRNSIHVIAEIASPFALT